MRKILKFFMLVIFIISFAVGCSRKISEEDIIKSKKYLEIGKQKYFEEDYNGAIKYFGKAIKLNPKDDYAYFSRGRAKEEQCDYNGALKDYDKSIKLEPKESLGYWARIALLKKVGKNEKVLDDYDMVIKLYNNDKQIIEDKKYFEEKILELKNLDEAIKINPENKENYRIRGTIKHFYFDRYEEAVSDYSMFLKISNDTEIFYSRGRAQYELKNYGEAIKDFNEAIRLSPKNSDYFSSRGLAKEKLGLYQEALEDYKMSDKLNSKDTYFVLSALRKRELEKKIAEQKTLNKLKKFFVEIFRE